MRRHQGKGGMNSQFTIRVSENGSDSWYWELARSDGQVLARGVADSQPVANDHAIAAISDWLHWQGQQANSSLSTS